MQLTVIDASSPFRLSTKMLMHNKRASPPLGPPFDFDAPVYPFANGSIKLSALTPSASAWKFTTTR